MWLILLGTSVTLLLTYLLERRRRQESFALQSIPGPKPSLLWGNLKELKRGSNFVFMEWEKKYGKTFCYFEGDRPILVTSDLEILKHILIKDFANFHSRAFSFFFTPDEGLVHAKGQRWKRLRSIVTPAFTVHRMKGMSPLLNSCVDGLLEVFKQRAMIGKAFDITTVIQRLTLTAIASCAFGLEVDALKDPDNIFLSKCREAFDYTSKKRPFYFPLVAVVGLLFPMFIPVIRYFMPNLLGVRNEWLSNAVAALVESRRNDKVTSNSFIQLLLNAEQHCDEHAAGDFLSLEMTVNDDNDAAAAVNGRDSAKTPKVNNRPNDKTRGKVMTLKEIQAECMTFLIAGYETTSTALSFAIYDLALNADVQQKLQREVDEHFSSTHKIPDYRSVQGMPYMDMVFSETLRLHSIAGVATVRECAENWQIDGLHIPRGTIIKVHMEGIHKALEHWGPEDTEKFVPERFLPQRKAARNSLAWLPFGAGPRRCIGMRFALMEAKVTLARVLQKFTILSTEETQVPLKVTSEAFMKPSQGVFVKLSERSAGQLIHEA